MTELELCWGTLERATLAELLVAASGAGFDTVTVAPHMYYRLDDADRRHVHDLLASGPIRVNVIDAILGGLPGSPDPEQVEDRHRAGFRYSADECFELAALLGAPIVNVAHFLGQPAAGPALTDAVLALGEQARDRGLRLTVEFLPGTGIGDVATAAEVVRRTAGLPVSIMLDTWHLARSGGTVEQLELLPPGAVGGLQVSDRIAPPAGTPYRTMEDRLLPGAGQLPLAGILRAVLEANPDVPVGVEVFSAELRALGPAEAARRARQAIAAALPA